MAQLAKVLTSVCRSLSMNIRGVRMVVPRALANIVRHSSLSVFTACIIVPACSNDNRFAGQKTVAAPVTQPKAANADPATPTHCSGEAAGSQTRVRYKDASVKIGEQCSKETQESKCDGAGPGKEIGRAHV